MIGLGVGEWVKCHRDPVRNHSKPPLNFRCARHILRCRKIIMRGLSLLEQRIGQRGWRHRWCSLLTIALLQSSSVVLAEDLCAIGTNGFERTPTSGLQITAAFLKKPAADAAPDEIKKHIVFSRIFGRSSTIQLNRSTSGQCVFGAETNGLDLHFHLFNNGKNVSNECGLRRCTSLLSDLMQSTQIDPKTFSLIIKEIVADIRVSEAAGPKYPLLAAHRAAREAYRHIYSDGTVERIFAELSERDFSSIDFGEFLTWQESQRSELSMAQRNAGSRPSVSSTDHNDICLSDQEISVRSVDIEGHGWGQPSIIMIKNAHVKDGPSGISNEQLRALCSRTSTQFEGASASPWRELGGRVQCFRQRFNQDRWLVLYAPAAREQSFNLAPFAQKIADALRADGCAHGSVEVFAVTFSRPQ